MNFKKSSRYSEPSHSAIWRGGAGNQ